MSPRKYLTMSGDNFYSWYICTREKEALLLGLLMPRSHLQPSGSWAYVRPMCFRSGRPGLKPVVTHVPSNTAVQHTMNSATSLRLHTFFLLSQLWCYWGLMDRGQEYCQIFHSAEERLPPSTKNYC